MLDPTKIQLDGPQPTGLLVVASPGKVAISRYFQTTMPEKHAWTQGPLGSTNYINVFEQKVLRKVNHQA